MILISALFSFGIAMGHGNYKVKLFRKNNRILSSWLQHDDRHGITVSVSHEFVE